MTFLLLHDLYLLRDLILHIPAFMQFCASSRLMKPSTLFSVACSIVPWMNLIFWMKLACMMSLTLMMTKSLMLILLTLKNRKLSTMRLPRKMTMLMRV